MFKKDQTPQEYRQELTVELAMLEEKQANYPTEYKERRIAEIRGRLNKLETTDGNQDVPTTP